MVVLYKNNVASKELIQMFWLICMFKSPMFKIDEDNKTVPEAFAEEAKYFTEVRLLQRDVKILLEGTSNQNLLGTIIHPVSL